VKVALDTNVLVSAFATRGLCADVFNLVLAEHELIVGPAVLSELRAVLRGKFMVPERVVDEVVALIHERAVVVGTAVAVDVAIRDADDAAVLAEAMGGSAEVLVTGDRDLLVISQKLPIRILTPRGFWDSLR
jgi:putative PIN family toxin of toxin-antitoxin system